VQLVWRGGPGGAPTVEVDGGHVEPRPGWPVEVGPGAVVVDGLAPDQAHRATLRWPGREPIELAFRTLPALPGPERCRIATISDLHLGQRAFGHRHSIVEHPRPAVPAGIRCAREALRAAVEWGAELIVVKGDLTNAGRGTEWSQAADLFAEVEVPVVVLPGNHDTGSYRTVEPWQAAEKHGIHLVRAVEAIDLPAVRVVLATTSIIGRSRGRLEHRREDLLAAVEGSPAALVVLHHHLGPDLDLPGWPPGIPREEADRFLRDLAEVQPASLVTCGHTHRHRRRRDGPITTTQVGSTKDYPGVWAGYTVHDDGIGQLVRRVDEPSCLRWTDATRRALYGLWGRSSPGHLSDRCFTLPWTR